MNRSPLDVVLSKFPDAKPAGKNKFGRDQWKARCPAHPDNQASLSIGPGEDGGVTLKCFAGCAYDDILRAAGLSRDDAKPLKQDRAPVEKWTKIYRTQQILAAYDYTDADGNLLYQSLRVCYDERNEATGETRHNPKDFAQRRPDGNGGWIWKTAGMDLVLYRLPDVLKAVAEGRPVWIPEGEKDADNLEKIGFVATTNKGGGNSRWQSEYSEILRGAHIVILPDNDVTGRKHAQEVAASVHPVAASVRVVELPSLPLKGDVSDWLKHEGNDAARLWEMSKAAPLWTPTVEGAGPNDLVLRMENDGEAEGRGPSVATRLVQIARSRFTLWHTDDGTAYATVPVGSHNETWAIGSTGFRDQLTRAYFAESGNAINNNAMQAALAMLSTFARLEGDERKVYTRKADLSGDGVIYVDLCNSAWQAVKITATGWEVVDKPPVSFRRAKGALPLPLPIRGGSLAELRHFVNMPGDGGGDILIFAWLLAALGPHNPYPILQLMGEQGTAKSNAARCLRALVDPAGTDLRREPKEDRDIAIAAKNAFVVAFDNVSSFPVWLSDTLCTLSTGGGFGTRKLHSDDEEALFQYKAPVLLTGIGEPSTRPDFLERALLVNLPVIPPEKRKSEADVLPAFEAARPRIFGALLDALACGLRNFPTTRLAASPRMADLARWVVACEPACPWKPGEFLAAYNENQEAGGDAALDADKIAPLVIRLVEMSGYTPGRWQGTSSELLAAFGEMVSEREKSFLPKNARSLSLAVTRIAPALRTQRHIEAKLLAKDWKGNRPWLLQKVEYTTEQNSKTTEQNHGAKPISTEQNISNNDGERDYTEQTEQTEQNFPDFSSLHFLKKEEETGTKGGETSRGENAPGFAPFAPLLRGMENSSAELVSLQRFVQGQYAGVAKTPIVTDPTTGALRVGYVDPSDGLCTGFWRGPARAPLAMGADYWETVAEPFIVPDAAEEGFIDVADVSFAE